MLYHKLTVGPLAAPDPDGVAEAQTLSGGGEQSLNLNGALVTDGVAVLDTPRRVAIDSVGDDSALEFTVKGTDRNGVPIEDTFAGGNAGATMSALDFKTVTAITVTGDTAGNVEAGTNQVASSAWAIPDMARASFNLSVATDVGTMTYDLEHTYERMARSKGPFKTYAKAEGKSADFEATYDHPVTGVRATTTAYTSGKLVLYVLQSGLRE